MTLWIDADACPRAVKELVFRAALRTGVPAVMVANSTMHVPRTGAVRLLVVDHGPDVADAAILEQSEPGDLVVTADIPLAAQLVDGGRVAINPRGQVYTAENVKEALATRNLMQELRDQGMETGGPAPMKATDTAQFANALDRELTRMLRREAAREADGKG